MIRHSITTPSHDCLSEVKQKTLTHKQTRSMWDKRWKWKQANEKPENTWPFKESKSRMVTSKQHSQLKGQEQNKATEKRQVFEVALLMQVKGRWAGQAPGHKLGCLAVLLSVPPHLSGTLCFSVPHPYVTQFDLSCLSVVALTLHPLIYLSACLSPFLHPFLIRLGVYLWVALSLCIPAVGIGERGGGSGMGGEGSWGLEKGSQGTHRSTCLWSLHYRIWHSARAHLISLQHTHTPT